MGAAETAVFQESVTGQGLWRLLPEGNNSAFVGISVEEARTAQPGPWF